LTGRADRFPNLLARLWRHLGPRRQRQFQLVLGLTFVSTSAEIVSLGAVMPFLAVLTAPDALFTNPTLFPIATRFGITSAQQLVLPVTLAFVAAALLAGLIRGLLLWASTRLAFACGSDLSAEVYRRTLYQPYSVHVARNSSDVISSITLKVDGVVFYVLVPMMTLLSSFVSVIAISLILFLMNPVVAGITSICFGGAYAAIIWASHRQLRRCGQRIAHEQSQVVRALQEGLGGIRDVLLNGTQQTYCNVYRQAAGPLRRAQGYIVVNSGSPRFGMEVLGMVIIAAIAYALSRQPGGLTAELPFLGALALGAQRLLPALQQSYGAVANISASQAALADTLTLLDQPLPPEAVTPPPPPLDFRQTIRLEGVRFRYTPEGPDVLDGLDLTIHRGSRVGFVGRTGSGKSTLIDLLMGLLIPSAGTLFVDDIPLSGPRSRAWQRILAHVPQNIYLSDTSFAENIAFGVPVAEIDMDRVRRAARQSQIADFIETGPQGYQGRVGERGVSLSGGQRQRVGIARALYRQATVLVFDEATSALDNATERSVMEAIDGLDPNLTILLIAHRLTTVQSCDTIIELEKGRVVAQGTFTELLQRSTSFRQMAEVERQ